MTAPSAPRVPPQLDRLGLVASTACALHCAATALVPTVLALLGASALLDHEAEWVFTVLAVGVASLALALGWRRHGASMATLALSLGIVGLLCARVLEEGGHGHGLGLAVSLLSGGALVTGHILNLRRTPAAAPEPESAPEPCCVPE
ncbi:MAG: MerC domain-containing protein [Nannocystales bacterium]